MLVLCMCTLSMASEAQTVSSVPWPFTQYGQMLVPGKTYTGTYKDTLNNSGSLFLTACVRNAAGALVPGVILGDGVLEVKVWETKITGGPYGAMTLESSFDGVNWGPQASTYDSTVIDSATSIRRKTFHVSNADKCAPYIRVRITVPSGITQSSSYVAQYFLNRRQYITLSK